MTRARQVYEIAASVLRTSLLDSNGVVLLLIVPMLVTLVLGILATSVTVLSVGVVTDDPAAAPSVVASLRTDGLVEARVVGSRSRLESDVRAGHLAIGVHVAADGRTTMLVPDDRAGSAQAADITTAALQRRGDASAGEVVVRGADGGPATSLLGFQFAALGDVVFLLCTSVLTMTSGIVGRRQLGIERRICATPMAPSTFFAGDVLGRAATATVQGSVMILTSALAFDVHWGAPLPMASFLLAWALVCGAIGTLVGTFVTTKDQAHAIGPALGIALGLVGGCILPAALVPGSLQSNLAWITPHRWALELLLGATGRPTSVHPAGSTAVLLGVVVVAGGVAARRFPATERRVSRRRSPTDHALEETPCPA